MSESVGRKVVLEAFARHGVKVSEDDPIVIVGTVIELGMDAAVLKATAGVKDVVTGTLQSGLNRYTDSVDAASEKLKAGAEAASYRAEQAVKRALSVSPDAKWKYFASGVGVGGGLVFLGVLVDLYLRH